MKSLDHRRDLRSVEQFQQDIKHKTSVERILLNHWIKEMEFRSHTVEVQDFGIDNTGSFVPLSDSRPDFELRIDGNNYLYEVKQNPYTHRNSFKVHDLKTYLQYDARILLFYGVGRDGSIYYDSRWAILQPSVLEKLLTLPRKSTDKAWGNKEIVILYKEDFHRYFRSYEFNHLRR